MHSEYRITDQRATASWQSHLPLKDLKEQWLPRRSSESLKLTLCQTNFRATPLTSFTLLGCLHLGPMDAAPSPLAHWMISIEREEVGSIRYLMMRRFLPTFLRTLEFESTPASESRSSFVRGK